MVLGPAGELMNFCKALCVAAGAAIFIFCLAQRVEGLKKKNLDLPPDIEDFPVNQLSYREMKKFGFIGFQRLSVDIKTFHCMVQTAYTSDFKHSAQLERYVIHEGIFYDELFTTCACIKL
jgi:hypothetical protein